jgi:hypothetical protein
MRAGLCVAWLTCGALAAQEAEIAGTVTDRSGAPIAGARIEFEALPLQAPRSVPGQRGRYDLAQARQRADVPLPRTATDRTGRWRVLLTPAQAALGVAGATELEMRVHATGHTTWRRAIGTSLLAASEQRVALTPAPSEPLLRLRARLGTAPPSVGFAIVERSFRLRGSQAIWLQDVVPLAADGSAAFAEPPDVPGEPAPPTPRARAEGYRVTVLAADADPWRATLAPGTHDVALERSVYRRRRVLAERAEPAKLPVRATWRLAGRDLALDLPQPAVPLLGGEEPIRIDTGSGPVEIDAWDPDLPLFAARPDAGAQPAPADAQAPPPGVDLEFAIRARGQPVYGAALWLENQGVERAGAGAQVFATSDARGGARLRGVPRGTFRFLVRHPRAGSRELLVDVRDGLAPQAVDLAPVAEPEPDPPGQPGRLRIALARAESMPLEVGILLADRTLVRRTLPDTPRVVRIEGLVPGPATIYLRAGDTAPLLLGGVLATAEDAPPLRADAAPLTRVELAVRGADGAPAAAITVGLGESGEPTSATLFAPHPAGEPGRFVLELRGFGAPWLRVQDARGARADVELPLRGEPVAREIALTPAGG